MDARESIINKVRKLIDLANSTTFDEERKTFLAKADELMALHTIEQFQIDMARPATERAKPELRTVVFPVSNDENFTTAAYNIFSRMAAHCRVKVGLLYISEANVVGYPNDLDYLEVLYTSVMLQLAKTITPSADPTVSVAQNIANMKAAGYQWEKIYKLLRAAGMWENEGPFSKPIGLRIYGMYKKLCEESGTAQVKANPKQWAESFTLGFRAEITQRMTDMHRSTSDTIQGSGKGLVLAGMEDMLLEYFYEMFPDKRPHPPTCTCPNCKGTGISSGGRGRMVRYTGPRLNGDAINAGRRAGAQADLSGGKTIANRKALG